MSASTHLEQGASLPVLLTASGEPRSRIQIAKLGTGFKDARYGVFDITEAEVQSWARNLSLLPGGRAAIDFDHMADRPGPARRTEAAGWITAVALEDGVPMAAVEWTPKGQNAIRDKEYLFFSPAYGSWTDEKGQTHPNTLIGGALSNRPFLNMPTVALDANAAQVQARLDAAITLSDASAITLGEALLQLDTPAPSRDLSKVTMLELCDDSDTLHDVVMALMAEKRMTYMESLGWLLELHDEASSWVFGDERDAITLSAVLDGSGVSPARVMTLVAEQEEVRTLAAAAAPKHDLDKQGRVKRPAGTDLDGLLGDPLAVRRDFRTARDLGLVNDDGIAEPDKSPVFKDFEGEWRSAVNAGADHLATLQLADEQAQQVEASIGSARVTQLEWKVQDDRATAARKQRELAAQLLEDAARLETR